MNKQTTVEWLINEISVILGPLETKPMQDLLMVDAVNKAKEMEKEQLTDAYWDGGQDIPLHINTCEEWYKRTYGGNK